MLSSHNSRPSHTMWHLKYFYDPDKTTTCLISSIRKLVRIYRTQEELCLVSGSLRWVGGVYFYIDFIIAVLG